MFLETFLLFVNLATLLCSVVEGSCNSRSYASAHPTIATSVVCVCSEDDARNQCKQGDFAHHQVSPDPNVATVYRTAKDGERFVREEVRFSTAKPSNQIDQKLVEVTIDGSVKFQKILGFGGAFTDSSGYNIVKLPKVLQDRLMADYYGPDGIGYTLGRVPIGGCDFSMRNYTLDDLKSGEEDDEALSRFSLQAEDFAYKIPFMKLANELTNNTATFFGSPWGAPAWMRDRRPSVHDIVLSGAPGGKYYRLYARYLAKFIKEYEKQGVPIWGVTVVNEPEFGFGNGSRNVVLGFTGATQRDFLKLDLGPEFERAGLRDKRIMIFDDNVPKMGEFVRTVLDDPVARRYVSGIAFHWYLSGLTNQGPTLANLSATYPGQFLLSTEACESSGDKVVLGKWDTFTHYSIDIIEDLNHGAVGWVDWNLVLDLGGGPNWISNWVDAPVIVNSTNGEYLKQPSFYALGQFAKFLVPGSVRLKHSVTGSLDSKILSEVKMILFERPDQLKVLTVLNAGQTQVELQFTDPIRGYLRLSLKDHSLQSVLFH